MRSSFSYAMVSALALAALAPADAFSEEPESSAALQAMTEYVRVPLNVSLFPGVSVGEGVAGGRKVVNHLSLYLVAGRAARLEGLECGIGWNHYSESVSGLQVSGILNRVERSTIGCQCAGLGNAVGGRFGGLQVGGLGNGVGNRFTGVQCAGLGNAVSGRLIGGQWAGLANGVSGDVTGAQWAGLVNAVSGDIIGAQWAGLVNAVSGDLAGGQWAGLVNAVSEGATGVQAAGVLNTVSGSVVGAQWAGLGNAVSGSVSGGQWAGLANMVSGPLQGLQCAGLANMVSGPTTSAQWAGITNLVSGPCVGAQWAGIGNIVSGPTTGAQWAGIGNVVSGPFVGAQWAGIGNVTVDAAGLQVAGIVNRTHRFGRGVRLAVFNYSRESEAIPLGLVSYVRNVGLSYDIWGDETRFLHVGLRSGPAHFHNIAFVGGQAADPFRWTAGLAAGFHLALSDVSFLMVDVSAQHVHEEGEWTDDLNQLHKLRLLVGRRLDNGGSLYGGLTANYFLSEVHDGSDIAPWSISDYRTKDRWERFWPGVTVGLRF